MLLTVAPPPDLRPWVQGAVVLRSPAALTHTRFPALTGSMLVFRLAGSVSRAIEPGGREQTLSPAVLIPPSPRWTTYAHAGEVHAIGLVLHPQALHGLVQGSAATLADHCLGVADLPTAAVLAPLHEVMLAASNDAERVQHLFAALRKLMAVTRSPTRGPEPAHLIQAVQTLPPAAAAQALGMGVRQLQRLCLAHCGLSPKQMHAITRLHAVLRRVRNLPASASLPGADLALAHGYYDQSHLARALRQMAGTPLRQLAHAPDGGDWPLQADAHLHPL